LAVALDVSAATGKSVVEVSSAMAKGFSGQTTALTRLGAGLSKATLASGDMNKILDELQSKFSGQALARLDTYAGQMDLLTVAAFNAKETIGKGLLEAISLLGDNKDIQSATKEMDKFAKSTSDATIGAGVLLSTLKGLKDIPGIGPVLKAIYSQTIPGLLGTLGRQEQAKQKSNFTYSLGSGAATEIAAQKEAAAIKAAAKARAEELRLLKQKNAIENKNVEELKKKFDLERIGLTAALNNATDEETKLRLRAQLAILDNNDALAKKILAEMEAADALKKITEGALEAARALFAMALAAIKSSVQKLNEITASAGGGSYTSTTFNPSIEAAAYTFDNGYARSAEEVQFVQDVVTRNVYSKMDRADGTTVNLTVNGSIMTEQNIVDVVQNSLLTIQRQGGSTSAAGLIP
jgi:cell division septum initiation protein DivIVA